MARTATPIRILLNPDLLEWANTYQQQTNQSLSQLINTLIEQQMIAQGSNIKTTKGTTYETNHTN